MANIVKDGFPELHGPAVKAANTKSLVPFALSLQQRAVSNDPTDLNRHALKVVQSLDEAYGIMYGGGMFLTGAEADRLHHMLFRLGMNYQILARKTAEAGEARWKQPMK
eukprot:3755191-Lingulodinium_polyedra.AAC.1